jgi:hypothetical protein
MARGDTYEKFCPDCRKVFYTTNNRDVRCPSCTPECAVNGCTNPSRPHSRGLCGAHASRLWKHGTPTSKRLRNWQTGPCSADGCDEAAVKRGFCELHYSRVRRTGSPGPAKSTKKPRGVPCEVAGCTRMTHANGLCSMHGSRLRFRNDLGPAEPLIAPDGSGHFTKKGYKIIHVDGRRILEHRYVMEQHLGRRLTAEETVHHVRDEMEKPNNDITNLELWSSRHPSGQRVTDKVAFAVEMAKLYPGELAKQGFRLMPLESAESTQTLLGEPSYRDFDPAAVIRRWTNA